MRDVRPDISVRRACRILEVPRAAIAHSGSPADVNRHLTYGYRCLRVLLPVRNGMLVEKKTVQRILEKKSWFCYGCFQPSMKSQRYDANSGEVAASVFQGLNRIRCRS